MPFDGFKTLTPVPGPPTDACGAIELVEPPSTLDSTLSFHLQWVPWSDGGPGLLVSAGGGGQLGLPLEDGWVLTIKVSSASAVDFLIRDWNDVEIGGPADASFTLSLERPADGLGPYRIDVTDSVRLEAEAFSFTLGVSSSVPIVRALAHNAALMVAAQNDAVLERSMDSDRLRVDFELCLGFAEGRFYIEGGRDLRAIVPIGKSLGRCWFTRSTWRCCRAPKRRSRTSTSRRRPRSPCASARSRSPSTASA